MPPAPGARDTAHPRVRTSVRRRCPGWEPSVLVDVGLTERWALQVVASHGPGLAVRHPNALSNPSAHPLGLQVDCAEEAARPEPRAGEAAPLRRGQQELPGLFLQL